MSSSSKRKKHKNDSHHEDRRRSKKKRKKSKSEKHKKKKRRTRSDESEGESEPEEGEITESEREECESTRSSASSSSAPSKQSHESDVEEPSQPGERRKERILTRAEDSRPSQSDFSVFKRGFRRLWFYRLLTRFDVLFCSQRDVASMCESDCGQIACAASGHLVHHHCRLYSHLWQVCSGIPTQLKVTTAEASPEENLLRVCREKDMDHAVRIPEMGVSKVPFSRRETFPRLVLVWVLHTNV